MQDDALEEAGFEDIPGITVRRHLLEGWIDKPFLERTLPGCMVRLSLGERTSRSGVPVRVYMLAQVWSASVFRNHASAKRLHVCDKLAWGPLREAVQGKEQSQVQFSAVSWRSICAGAQRSAG